METVILNLTKKQKETLSSLDKGQYDKLNMANITRLLKKIIVNDELTKQVVPQIAEFQKQTMGKTNNTEIKRDIMKRIKDFPNKTIINEIISDDAQDIKPISKDKSDKPQFDTDKSLEDLLDDLVKPKKIGGDKGLPPLPNPKLIIGGDKGRPPIPQKSDDSGMAEARQKKLGEDGKGLPPKKPNKLKAMAVGGTSVMPSMRDDVDYLPVKPDTRGGGGSRSKEEISRKELEDIYEQYLRMKERESGGDRTVLEPYNPYKPSKKPKPSKGGDEYVYEPYEPYKPSKKPSSSDGIYNEPYYPSKTKVGEDGKGILPPKKDAGKGKVKPYEPYSGKAYQLSESDIKNKQPATIQEFMKRNNRSGVPKKEDYEAYDKYMDNAKDGIDDLKSQWQKIQDDIARNRQKSEQSGEAGQPITDKDDPFGILRSLGYKYTTDIDDQSVGVLSGSFMRAGGDIISMIPIFGESELGQVIRKGFDIIGDITEGVSDWAVHKYRENQYEHGKISLDEIRAHGTWEEDRAKFYADPKNKGVGYFGVGMGDRGDMYYQPKWKTTDYLPTKVDAYGYPNLNGGLQDQYLKPLERYSNLLNSEDVDFLDSVSPEQKQFLEQLRATIVKIKHNDLNITHVQYRELLRAMINEFTPEQKANYLNKVNEDVMKDVQTVYESGADGNIGTVQGGSVPFGQKFIQDVQDVITPKDPQTEGGETDAGTKEQEEDEGDEPEEPRYKPDEPDEPKDEDKEPPEEEPPKPEAPEVKEQSFFTDFGQEPKYRPRGQWGGTDELFQITNSEKQKRNLIIESSTLNEGIDRTNPFFKRQQIEYDMRYRNTFPMVNGGEPFIPKVSEKYNQANRSVWISQRVPTFRPMEDSMRDAYSFGQYQNWNPKYDYTTTRGVVMTNTSEFPSVADSLTQGEDMIVKPMTSYEQMIMNQRWMGR